MVNGQVVLDSEDPRSLPHGVLRALSAWASRVKQHADMALDVRAPVAPLSAAHRPAIHPST
jgi:hypothetical protein